MPIWGSHMTDLSLAGLRGGFALAVLAAAPAANGDTWDIFESRCLAPLEAEQAPNVEGLERAEARDVANSQAYRTEEGLFYTEADPNGRVWACSAVKQKSDDQVIAVEKMQDRVAEERYVAGISGNNPRLVSTDWRKPKLQVDLALLLGDTVLMAREVRK